MYFYQRWTKQETSMGENIENAINKIITAYIQAESEENKHETSGINSRAS